MPMITGEHVTLEAGTGLVHTAPAHGAEDFDAGVKFGLPLDQPVDDRGRFKAGVPHFAGQGVREAEKPILEMLSANGSLLRNEPFRHSYPHCWRHKTPIIFRATTQWFIGMDRPAAAGMDGNGRTLRETAQKAIADTTFYPVVGKIAHRGDGRRPPGLDALAPAQLGRAAALLPRPRHRRAAPGNRTAGRGGRRPRRRGRHRSMVRGHLRGLRRRPREVPQAHRHRGRLVRLGHHALLGAARPEGAEVARRPLPRGLGPAPRLVPVEPAHQLRDGRPRALRRAPHPRLRGGRPGPEDVEVAGQRHRAPEGVRHAGRRDHPAVGRLGRLLRRALHLRRDPQARRGELPPHPQHAAVPARQHRRLRRRRPPPAPRASGWRSTATPWR